MSIINVNDKCCMCRNCTRVCKFDAISYEINQFGFKHAVVNTNKCVNCNQCERVCPAINENKSDKMVYKSGYSYAIDFNDKKNGSSGGLFGVFAKQIINNNGIVYGAAFDDNLNLVTTRAEKEKELVPLYKSKYLLCDTRNSFENIKRDLINKKNVLYCSSPCQIHALKLYLKQEFENLITVDFVCHGVSDQEIFNKFRSMYENDKSCKLNTFEFRHKINKASSSHYFNLTYKKNDELITRYGLYYEFPYYNAYCKQLICRSNCYDCKYASINRVSDITIGDFHNVEDYFKNVDRFSGVSMFICNTLKGQELLNECKSNLCINDVSKETLYSNNRFTKSLDCEIKSSIYKSEKFLYEFLNNGMNDYVKKQLITKKDYLKMIYYKMPLFIRKNIRSLYTK